jgi:hypothetical protein
MQLQQQEQQQEQQAALATSQQQLQASQQQVQQLQASYDTLRTILEALHTSLTPSNLRSIFSGPGSETTADDSSSDAVTISGTLAAAMEMFSLDAAGYQQLGQRLSKHKAVEYDDAQLLLERLQVRRALLAHACSLPVFGCYLLWVSHQVPCV